jgi:quercetin dioxygenase-like cupin family protein
MGISKMQIIGSVAIMFTAVTAIHAARAQVQSGTAHPGVKVRARIAFVHPLPKLDSDRLKATVVEVKYGPGESSKPHSHPCAVIGYVVQGLIRTQVKGQPEALINKGESFYEAPNGVHLVSANASRTEPASFIAFFVCDGDQPLSKETPATSTSGGR